MAKSRLADRLMTRPNLLTTAWTMTARFLPRLGWKPSIGIQGNLVIGFGTVVAAAALIAFVSWQAFHALESSIAELASRTMPARVANENLVNGAIDLDRAVHTFAQAATPDDAERLYGALSAQIIALQKLFATASAQPFNDSAIEPALERLATSLDGVAGPIDALRSTIGTRFSLTRARAASYERARTAHEAFLDAALRVERLVRGQASLELSTQMARVGGKDDVHRVIARFVQNDMSWVGTAQELRIEAGLLMTVMVAAVGEDRAEQVARLKERALLSTVRLSGARLLPASPQRDDLTDASTTIIAAATGPDNVFDRRLRELEARQLVLVATRLASEAIRDIQDSAARVADGLNALASRQVAGASDLVVQHSRILVALLVAVVLLAGLIVRHYVGSRIVARLKSLGQRMSEASGSDTPPAEVAAWSQAFARQGDDEISAMARAMAVFVETIAHREAALRRAKAEVEQALAELERAQLRLVQSEKMAALGRLVGGVGHEINTPLGTALTSVSFLAETATALQDRVRDPQNRLRRADLETFLHTLEEAASLAAEALHRAIELVHAFKRLAPSPDLDGGDRCALREVLSDVVALFHARMFSGHTLRIDCPDDHILRGSPEALVHVLTELLSNAAQHAYPDRRAGELRITGHETAGRLLLTVDDDGDGIPEGLQRTLFEPFVTSARGYGHAGLGLSIVYNLVHHTLRGSIAVESASGSGTRVILELPLAEADADRDATPAFSASLLSP